MSSIPRDKQYLVVALFVFAVSLFLAGGKQPGKRELAKVPTGGKGGALGGINSSKCREKSRRVVNTRGRWGRGRAGSGAKHCQARNSEGGSSLCFHLSKQEPDNVQSGTGYTIIFDVIPEHFS